MHPTTADPEPGDSQHPARRIVRQCSSRRAASEHAAVEQSPSRRGWVVIDTLDGPDQATLILDDTSPRGFSRLSRASIARNNDAAHHMPDLVDEAFRSHATQDLDLVTPDGHHRMIAVPVLGPSDAVHAVALWVGDHDEPLPRIPILGAIEWDSSGLVTATPAAQLLLGTYASDGLTCRTTTDMLAAFDSLTDRHGFLALFNLAAPADRWHGTATTTDESDQRREVFLAARATRVGSDRRVRAVVARTVGSATSRPDLALAAIRHMPIPPGHALALVDLRTGFVHEWLTADGSPLAAWRHHNPIFSDEDKVKVVETVVALASGATDVATTRAAVRFSPGDEPILLTATWTRILDGERPQALLDITPLSAVVAPPVADCPACRELAADSTRKP